MAVLKSIQAAAGLPVPNADGAMEAIPIFADWLVPASGLVSGDIVEMVPLPPGYVPVDAIIDHENLGTAFTGQLGIMSGAYGEGGSRTCGAELVASATYQAAAIKRMNVPGAGMIAPSDTTRSIGFAITGTLTSPVAGAKLRVTVFARPKVEGV